MFIFYILGGSLLLCPSKVKSFSLGVYSQNYYSCNKEGEIPVLKSCPINEVYWAAKEMCSSKLMKNIYSGRFARNLDSRTYSDSELSSDTSYTKRQLHSRDLETFSEPVLGRNVYLGCLFDVNRNDILPEYSLWKEETITENKRTSASLSSTNKIVTAQSTLDRLAHTDYRDSLKLEFLGKFKLGCYAISISLRGIRGLNKIYYRISTLYIL